MISYPIGDSGQILIIDDTVLEHFKKHQQTSCWKREAGGQLFVQEVPALNQLRIVLATGPRPSDKRTRTSYHPDRKAEQLEIDIQHAQNLDFIGDWHTHPEYQPTPSTADIASIASGYEESKHQLHAFILIIVGKGEFPENLYVGLHSPHTVTPLTPLNA